MSPPVLAIDLRARPGRVHAACYARRGMDARPDAQLVRCISAGSAERAAAETALCRRFAPRIRLYGLRHLRDEERARDLVQVVLIAVLQAARAGRIDEPDKLERYVLGTSRLSAQRMRARDARLDPTDDATLHAALGSGLDAAAQHAQPEARDLGALIRCVEGLEPRARQVVLLSFQSERSADDIAALLATNAGHVRVLRHRAIAALRRCLDGGNGASP